MSTITVSTTIKAPKAKVWEALTTPADIQAWCHASEDWCVGDVEVDLRTGGRFKTHMRANDGSVGFDFTGTYTRVVPLSSYAYLMDGAHHRTCTVTLEEVEEGVRVSETFDLENENSEEQQREGWLAILENLKQYVESK